MMGHNQKKREEIPRKRKQPFVIYDKLPSQMRQAPYDRN